MGSKKKGQGTFIKEVRFEKDGKFNKRLGPTRNCSDTSQRLQVLHSSGNNCGFCSNRILHYFPLFVRPCVTGVTSHISQIYKGINAMLIIRGPIKPYILLIKIILAIFLAKTRQDHLLCPDQPDH